MSTVALWSLALLAIACTTPATPGEGPSEDGVPEADSDEVDSGVGDTGADTADTADTAVPDTADTRDSADTADTTDTGPPPFWALPDEDLTDEVCSRVHEEIAIRDWYDYSWQNGILEDVTDSTGQLRWHVRYDENYDYPDARRFTSVYDAAGLRTQELETIDGDTEVTAARAYEYTPEGWLSVEWADDYNADGVFNRAWTWTYDADGRVVSAVSRNEPETSRYVTTTTWTPEGRTEVDESSAAGVVDWRETRTYTVDNLPLTDELDRDADGVPEYVYIWTRDEDGRLLSMSEATPYHAEAVYSVYTYDDEGLLVSEAGGWGWGRVSDGLPIRRRRRAPRRPHHVRGRQQRPAPGVHLRCRAAPPHPRRDDGEPRREDHLELPRDPHLRRRWRPSHGRVGRRRRRHRGLVGLRHLRHGPLLTRPPPTRRADSAAAR